MSKIPTKNKQWAKEAIEALELAFTLLSEDEYSDLSFEEKQMEMLNLAPAIAGMKRKIKDDELIKNTYDYVFENIKEDVRLREPGTENNYEIMFLLAYLDSHIAFKIITGDRADKIMEHLVERCEIPKFA